MAKVTAVDEFFGLPKTNWTSFYWGDSSSFDGIAELKDRVTGASTGDVPISLNADPARWLIELRYTQIVVGVSVTSVSAGRGPVVETLSVNTAREATEDDMLSDATMTKYPLFGDITPSLGAMPDMGQYNFILPTSTHQARPVLTVSEAPLPGFIIWATYTKATVIRNVPVLGVFFRTGPRS